MIKKTFTLLSWPVTLPDENTYKDTYFSTMWSITPKISSPSSR